MADPALAPERITLRRKILGVKIRHARTKAGLGLKEAGQALGVSPEAVSEIELGRLPVSLPHLEVLALIFNVPVAYFWSDEPIKEADLDFPTQEAIALRQRIIGALLRKARIERGRSQEQLANLLGIPVSKISDYEFGRTPIPLQELEALIEHLNLSLDYFLDQSLPFSASAPADNKQEGNGHTMAPTELTDLPQLSPEVREFLSNPANLLYVNIAMKLSELSADTLRALAEGLLEVTY
jgi:transcriptional regulator with XRE-family HTH domain